MTINDLIQAVRPTGRIGVVRVFLPEDPHAEDPDAKEGKFAFDFGTFFFKGQSMGTGQANVKQYNRQLRNLIHRDKLSPGLIVSHELNLDQAAEGYENFDNRLDGWTKVLLHPYSVPRKEYTCLTRSLSLMPEPSSPRPRSAPRKSASHRTSPSSTMAAT